MILLPYHISGLGFRPRPRDKNIDSTLIWFKNGNNEDNWKYWSDSLATFLERMYICLLFEHNR